MVANEGEAIAENWSSPGQLGDRETPDLSKQLAMRKACNECRQQKLRCNVVKNPLTPCTRCVRLHLECRIDPNFQRVEKRKERRDRQQSVQNEPVLKSPENSVGTREFNVEHPLTGPPMQRYVGDSGSEQNYSWTQQILSDTPGVSSSFPPPNVESGVPHKSSAHDTQQRLDGIALPYEVVQDLFKQYFVYYHPFLPFLDTQKPPEAYYRLSPLLYWAIIAVASRRYSSDLTLLPSLSISVPRLLWSTLQTVPQNYQVVKALCILCAWPFPKSNSAHDPTFILTGTMMNLAMQVGLHMPDYSQDFSKNDLTLRQDNLRDRYTTWATCNIVAQSVATSLGQPSIAKYDWPLQQERAGSSYLPERLSNRLRIENFCERVSQALYSNSFYTAGSADTSERFGRFQLLTQELSQLKSDLKLSNEPSHTLLYLRGAQVHLRLYALLDFKTIPPLLSLYQTCCRFLTLALSPEIDFLSYCPYYIFQLVLASGFTLLRFLRSSLTQFIDNEAGKLLFNSTISACRKISISNNDLPGRLAEVLAQLWAWDNHEASDGALPSPESRHSGSELQDIPLTVRSRMSVSIVYDSLLRWRKGFNAARHLTYSAPTNPTIETWSEEGQPDFETETREIALATHQVAPLDIASLDDMFPIDWVMDDVVGFPEFTPGES